MTSAGERTELDSEYQRSRDPLPWAPGPISLTDEPDWRERWDTAAEFRGER